MLFRQIFDREFCFYAHLFAVGDGVTWLDLVRERVESYRRLIEPFDPRVVLAGSM